MKQGTLFKVRRRFRPRPFRALGRVLRGIGTVLKLLPVNITFWDSD